MVNQTTFSHFAGYIFVETIYQGTRTLVYGAITKQIVVETHSSSLKVQSEVGQGAEFYIYLSI
ncbi:HAMP domain-containing histidine kinase [[Leptolyngbya] sp. PCC 7376]|uniref:HAMP domain-containing histidine kinase n=1 Tax=[Leptolyngbya] sp. PCC 7376 TaxID=111781 RepID=UPI00031A1D18|nr:HAMP domain-containing histidine kinase [[Leptolyngbya] sp. PCC 7376]